ncbi:cobalt-zinc-cadmium efflux system outer membrane protein [Catalinimonas alkaloidigena]|uniref:TolC family protein n=1 Tax=Catalinimonas alkaloidigena TaxID=1075417 RepID=UPI0024066D05|nr:TolC family protein [Catalinimonas alkaloidigena]MDF9795627.1 cobalt-zinc-cadmium efflux system outer membrane protein [Catalinimonas alkaloidigena]
MNALNTLFFPLLLLISLTMTIEVKAQSLSEYMKVGAENNPSLKAKYQEYLSALEKIPQVGALPDPRLSFGYFINPVQTRAGDQVARISLEQMLPWFGTLKARKDASSQEAKVRFEEFMRLRNELYFDVKKSYFQLHNIQQDIRLSKENIEILKSYEQIATQKYENDLSTMVDILTIQMQIRNEQNKLFTLEENLTAQYAQLNALLNRAPDAVVETPEGLPLSFDLMNIDSLRAQVLENHPSLSILREESELLALEARLADLSSKPEIGIGLDYGFMRARTDMEVPDNGMDMIMPMVSLSIPVFNKGKYTASLQEVKFRQENNVLATESQRNELIATLEATLSDYQIAQNKVKLYEAQIESTQQAISILNSAYETNSENFEDVLEFQIQLLEYRIMLNEALTAARIALARLEALTAVELIMNNDQ